MVPTWLVSEVAADAALDGWDAEAASRELPRSDGRYWTEGEPWMRDKCGVSDSE